MRRLCFALAVVLSGALLAAEPTAPAGWKERLATVKVERYVPAPAYSEGPSWRDGELFFCSDGLLRVTRDQQVRKYLDLRPAGTCVRGDGHLLVCDNKVPALLDVAPDGTVRVIVDRFRDRKLDSLNDLTIDRAGNVYWTDPNGSSQKNPVGKVFRVRPDGRVDLLADDLAFPNGIEVDPDNRYLYVIESQTAKVLRYDLPPSDQPLGRPVVFFALGGSGGDGCAFDAEGNLWVADFHRPETGNGRLTVLSPQGRVLGHLPVPARQVSNLTFGGAKGDEVFITTGEPPGVFRAQVGVAGFRGHPGKPLRVLRTLPLPVLDQPVKAP